MIIKLLHFFEFRIGHILTACIGLLPAAIRSGSGVATRLFACLLSRLVQLFRSSRPGRIHLRNGGIDRTLLLVLNAYHDVVDFALPSVTGGMGWMLLIDTNRTDGPGNFRFDSGTIYGVTGRSVLLFELEPEGSAAGLII